MRRLALAVLGAAPLTLALASFSGGRWAELLAAVAASSLPPALVLLVAGSRRGDRVVALALWLLLTGSLAGAVVLSWRPAVAGPFGLPRASLLVVAGVALAPLVLVSWGYAARFRAPADPEQAQRPAAGREDA